MNFDVLDETGVEKVRNVFEMLKPLLSDTKILRDKFEFSFKNRWTRISLDCIPKDGKLIKALMDLGLDISEYRKFNIAFKTGINLAEIFDPNEDLSANLIKICSLLFSIKSETDNMRYLLIALAETLRAVKLTDEKNTKKI